MITPAAASSEIAYAAGMNDVSAMVFTRCERRSMAVSSLFSLMIKFGGTPSSTSVEISGSSSFAVGMIKN